MPSRIEPLPDGLAQLRAHLLDQDTLVRAVASGGRRGGAPPTWRRVELRYVDLKAGRHLQLTAYDATQAHTSNHLAGAGAASAVDALLDDRFGDWHVETVTAIHRLRVTKRLEAALSSEAVRVEEDEQTGPARAHDRVKPRLLPEGDPVLVELGIATAEGMIKPSRQAKYRQVEEFLRLLDGALTDAIGSRRLRVPTPEDPLRIVDLGCGNSYLTFAAQAFLTRQRGLAVR